MPLKCLKKLCLWTKIRTKQWLVSMYACGFSPKCDNFACLQTRYDQSELHLKRWFFLPQSASSISGPLSSVIQTYTQSYSFDGRMKLIISQIIHELSVTIHEISTSWKKTLDGGSYRKTEFYFLIFCWSNFIDCTLQLNQIVLSKARFTLCVIKTERSRICIYDK